MQEILLRLPETSFIGTAVAFVIATCVINFIFAIIHEILRASDARMMVSHMAGPANQGWSLFSPVSLALVAIVSGLLTKKHSVE